MYHFFVEPEQIKDNEIRITGKDVNHGNQRYRKATPLQTP